ncbi:PEGA domain-containing protein, partial [Patescibacteria group bacterium]
IPSTSTPTSKAQYTVQYKSGPGYKTLPQSSYPNQWAPLGSYDFATSGGYVELHNVTGETLYTKRVVFDAMKWIWNSPTATLTVTSPNGGETWTKGSSSCMVVKWNSSGLSDTVRIELYKGGKTSGNFIKSIVDSVSNSGSYCVTKNSLAGLADGSDYYIRISNVNNACNAVVSDFSNSPFTIKAATFPNLTPYALSGWSDPLVVSNVAGTTTSTPSSLTSCKPTYIDFGVVNNGNTDISTSFYTRLYLDNQLIHSWVTNSLQSGYVAYDTDWAYTFSSGTHTLKLVADDGSAITESNELDNTYSKSFTWGDCVPTAKIDTNNGNNFQTVNSNVTIQATCKAAPGDTIKSASLLNTANNYSESLNGSDIFVFGGVPLKLGSNTIEVTCFGAAGKAAADAIVVTRLAQTGAISGAVTSGGSALGGATVAVAGPTSSSTTADSNGNFTLSGLPEGTYDVKANKPGYQEQVKTVSVSAGNTTVVNFSLTKIPSPVFYYSPNNIGVTMNSGSINSSQTFIVKNSGDAQLNYSPSVNVNWASVQKNGATVTGTTLSLAPGAQDILTIAFNSNGITSSQSGNITVSHNDATQGAQTIFLGMGINAPPPQPPPPAEQPPPSNPIFQPSLYGQCP